MTRSQLIYLCQILERRRLNAGDWASGTDKVTFLAHAANQSYGDHLNAFSVAEREVSQDAV